MIVVSGRVIMAVDFFALAWLLGVDSFPGVDPRRRDVFVRSYWIMFVGLSYVDVTDQPIQPQGHG